MTYASQTAIANRHDFDKTFTAEYSANQTEGVLITPTTGKSLKIVGVHVTTEATSGKVRIWFDNDVDGNENTIATGYATDGGGTVIVQDNMVVRGARDEQLLITSTFGASSYFVAIDFKEE